MKVNSSFFVSGKTFFRKQTDFKTAGKAGQGTKLGKNKKRAAILFFLAVALLFRGAWAEGALIPPSPEPPAERVERPTPGPTPVPDRTVIDHVNEPDVFPGFFFNKDAKLLDIWIPNIKDADEAILVFDGQVYMIDCGDDRSGARGAALLRQLGITRVDILFNSHLHHDHINGLDETDDAARVGSVRICFPADSTESGLRMASTAASRGIPVLEFRDGDVYSMGRNGEVTLTFLKNSEAGLDVNNQSAQTIVRYGERSILFTADMEKPGQTVLLRTVDPAILRCDIVKYPHHAKNGLIEEFYDALGAKLAVVTSVAGRGDAGQLYLSSIGMPAIYTYVQGKFTHLATDGRYWLCEYVDALY